MDPQVKSVLTTIGATVATTVAAAAATHGVIHADQQAAFVDIIVTLVGAAITAAIGWYKARQVSPTAAIQQVNAQDNGVKVVAENNAAVVVNQPLKGAK
jgi:arginine exporter protein ArgO